MKQLIKKFKQISMLLLVISIVGCENDDVLLPEVISGFTYKVNSFTGTVTFINTSVNSKNYFWTFGDETSSTEINPIKTYTTGTYIVTLKASNVAGSSNTFEATITINIVDEGTPVITLLGDATINIMVGDPFTDPGATATDDVDGDITANIVVAGDAVDVNTENTYTITYNVSDTYGNAAAELTRTVIVAADAVAPEITLTGGTTINITIGDAFTDPGATATDDVDGDITANIVVAGDAVDVNTAATYTITYNVSDAAGNAATEVTRTVVVGAIPSAEGVYFYSTAGTVDIVTVWGDWGTGTAQDGVYDQDATYNPCIKLSGGSWGALIAFTEFPAGTLAEYGNLEFKIKTDEAEFKIKVPEEEKVFSVADGTPLADGWVQISIPLSTWSTGVINAAMEFAIWGSGGTTLYLTDIMLSGEGGGTPPPSNCPAPPAGELLSNGDFEAGDVGCWQFFDGASISTTVNNGGSNSAEIQGATGVARGIKQERFAVGTLLPNTSYTVSFDIMSSEASLGIGGVMKAFTFSEGADGGGIPATLHTLTDNTFDLSTTWINKTFTFTTAPNANQVEGGLSFLIEIVNSSVKLNIDNVVIKVTP